MNSAMNRDSPVPGKAVEYEGDPPVSSISPASKISPESEEIVHGLIEAT